MVKVINETKGYTNLPNEFLRDKTMSMRAKLILVELISFPPNWRVSEVGLAACNSDGLSAVKTAIRELEKKGYLERKRQPGKKGQFGEMDYIVTIRKLDDDKLSSESPVMVNSDMGEPIKEEKANTTEKEHLEIDFTISEEQDDGESYEGESTDVQPAPLLNNYNKIFNNKLSNNQLSSNQKEKYKKKDTGKKSDKIFSNINFETANRDARLAIDFVNEFKETIATIIDRPENPLYLGTECVTEELHEYLIDNLDADTLKRIFGRLPGGLYSDNMQRQQQYLTAIIEESYRQKPKSEPQKGCNEPRADTWDEDMYESPF